MSRKCCVPACTGNYETGPKVSVFTFSNEEDLKSKWLRGICRSDFVPTKHSMEWVALAEIAQRIKEVCAKWKDKATEALAISETVTDRRIFNEVVSREDKFDLPSPSTRTRKKGIIANSSPLNSLPDLSNNKITKMVRWQDKMTPLPLENKSDIKNGFTKSVSLPNRTPSNEETSLSTVNMLNVPSVNNTHSILSRTYHYASYILKRRKNFVYTDVSKKVLDSARVKDAINQATIEEMTEKNLHDDEMQAILQKHQQRAVEVLNRMRSCISSVLLKIASWIMYKLLSRMLSGLHVNKRQIENLKYFSQQNIPVVYIPLHRSHLDYILVTYILYMNDMRAPLVAAGDNLFIPFFGMVMKGLGAFFIKRKLDAHKGRKDHVYRSLLHTYMLESLHEGHSLEFFIEGGRSRSGKSCLPKAGLLSVVVDSLVEGVRNDVYIVPVSISYEKIVDGNFVAEQLGRPKVMESFTTAVKAIWRTLHSNFGNTQIEFSQPFSLKEFLNSAENLKALKSYQYPNGRKNSLQQSFIRAITRRTSVYGTDIVIEDHRQVIKNLAEKIVYDASSSAVIMITNVIAFLLLTKYRKGATLQQLTNSFTWLRNEIVKRNRLVGFSGEPDEAIKQAYTLLGKQLLTSEVIQMEWSSSNAENNNVKIVFFKPVVQLPHMLELQYYANSVISVFLLDSVIVNAFYSLMEEKKTEHNKINRAVPRYQLINRALMLCDILQYEFIFTAPDTEISAALNIAINNLITDDLLIVTRVNNHLTRQYNFSKDIIYSSEESAEEEEEVFEFSQRLMAGKGDEQQELQFFRCILSPFIEGYWLAASSLKQLVGHELEESAVLQEIWKTANEYLHQGYLLYEESFAAEPLKNSLKLFEQWRVIETKLKDNLNYINVQNIEGVQSAIERIEMFRK